MIPVPEASVDLVEYHARNNNLPVDLIRIIIKHVSDQNPLKMVGLSTNGLYGLMQISEQQARHNGFNDNIINNLLDPVKNVTIGCTWLRGLRDSLNCNPNDYRPLIELAYPDHADKIMEDFTNRNEYVSEYAYV